MSSYKNPNNDPLRGSGRTTRQALEYANLAIHDAGLPVEIKDHFGSGFASLTLLSLVSAVLNSLGVPFSVDKANLTITVEPIPPRNYSV